jgi:acetolactate synthase-1/2/3 large subunit
VRRPVILLGHGATFEPHRYLEMGIPVLTSWQAKDRVDNFHPNYFGCPGIYGNRAANRILFEADTVYAVGNRCSIWNVGYEGFRPDQRVVMFDVDEAEVRKFPHAEYVRTDLSEEVPELISGGVEWMNQCDKWHKEMPWVESPTHDDTDYINSYRFTEALQKYLKPGQVIVTDMGTALICAHQVLKLKPPQRIMTSGGLGEMGCALPAAVGASFARDKGEVLCLTTDGGMMLNLQELQTIWHHQLPVKIIVYRNEGYLMIQHTQKMGRMEESGVDSDSGVSFPDYRYLANSMGFHACDVRTWEHFNTAIPQLFEHRGPALIQFHMKPRQPLVPKLDPVFVDGKPTSPPFWKMSPC